MQTSFCFTSLVSVTENEPEAVVNQAQTRRLSPTITKGQQSLVFVYTSKGISQDNQIKLFSFTWHLLQNNPTTTEPIFKDSFIFNGTVPPNKQAVPLLSNNSYVARSCGKSTCSLNTLFNRAFQPPISISSFLRAAALKLVPQGDVSLKLAPSIKRT